MKDPNNQPTARPRAIERLRGADLVGRSIDHAPPDRDLSDADLTLAKLRGEWLDKVELESARLSRTRISSAQLDLDTLARARRADITLDQVVLHGPNVECCRAEQSRIRLIRSRSVNALRDLAWPMLLIAVLGLVIAGQLFYSRTSGHPISFYSHDNYADGLSRALALEGNDLVHSNPALYHLPSWLWLRIFGPVRWALNLTPLCYLLLFGLGLYALAAELFDRRSAVVAGLLGALSPGVIAFTRVYDDHTLNLALATWFAWCLVRSERLTRPVWLLPAASLVLLARYSLQENTHWVLFLLGIAGPTAWVLLSGTAAGFRALGQEPGQRWRALRQLAHAFPLLLACLGLAAWFAAHTFANPYYLQEATDVGGAHFISIAQRPLAALGFYPYTLLTNVAGPMIAIAALIGLVLLFARRSPSRWLAALWLIVPMLLLSLIGKKEQPYLVAALPGALLAAAAWSALATQRSRASIGAGLVLLSAGWIVLTSITPAQYNALNAAGQRMFGSGIIKFVTPPAAHPSLVQLEADCAQIAASADRLYPDGARVYVLADDIRLNQPSRFFLQSRLPDGGVYNLGSSQRARLPRGGELLALIATQGPMVAGDYAPYTAMIDNAPFEPIPDHAWLELLATPLPLIQSGERYVLLGPLPGVAP
ncbi:MAG: glycosyltransferase family 39 protein [Candidatus Alcyoniella australis]|nr:glycosyltransferase family 39 protein [Candidatus Alcyoniella australis]